jgi:glycosyltransferase involved in cell wall biosynthesis
MRILQLHTRYRQAGGEDVVADAERDLLERAGHEVLAIRPNNAEDGFGAAVQLAGYTWNPAANARVMQQARKFRPDVAHFHNTWFATSPSVLRTLQRAGVPTVATLHNYRLGCANGRLIRDEQPCQLCLGSSPWQGVRHRCYRDSHLASAAAAIGIQSHRWLGTWTRNVNRFIALTEFSREMLVSAGIPTAQMTVKSNFVNDPGPRPAPPSRSKTVAFLGRLSPEKGLSVALRAWAGASPTDMELVVAGDGPQRAELEGLRVPGVRFLGHVDRPTVNALLTTSRAVLVPSLSYEAQPMGILEAFAAGTPALGSAIGGLAETTACLGARWQAPAGDVEAWALLIKQLRDDNAVDAAGEVARQSFERKYSPRIAEAKLADVYAEAVERFHA